MALPAADPFPPTAMWPGRAALWRPARRPACAPFAPPRALAPPGFWLVARTVGTLALGGGEVRVCTGGRDAIKVALAAASVTGAVVPPAGSGGSDGGGSAAGGGALGGTWVFAATARFVDAAAAHPAVLKFAFRLERPEDGPALRAAWASLAAAAERAWAVPPAVPASAPGASAPSAPASGPSAPAPASLVTVQAPAGGGRASAGAGGGGSGALPGPAAAAGGATASDAHAATVAGEGATPPPPAPAPAPPPLPLAEEDGVVVDEEEDEGVLADRILVRRRGERERGREGHPRPTTDLLPSALTPRPSHHHTQTP